MTDQELRFRELQETRRHNLEMENLQGGQLEETHRTNVENEGIKKESNIITSEHYVRQDAENVRHNTADENIRSAANQETQRHNVQDEALRSRGLDIETQKANEAARHNRADEDIRLYSAQETARHNRMDENIRIYTIPSTIAVNESQAEKYSAEANLANARTIDQQIENRFKVYTYPSETAKTVQENKRDMFEAANDREAAEAQLRQGWNWVVGISNVPAQVGRNVASTLSPITDLISSGVDIARTVTNVRNTGKKGK